MEVCSHKRNIFTACPNANTYNKDHPILRESRYRKALDRFGEIYISKSDKVINMFAQLFPTLETNF